MYPNPIQTNPLDTNIIYPNPMPYVQVRQAQLKTLLEQEHKQYESELKSLGKAFYSERI